MEKYRLLPVKFQLDRDHEMVEKNMKKYQASKRALCRALLIGLLIMQLFVAPLSAMAEQPTAVNDGSIQLSPGALEVANLIGVKPLVDRLAVLSANRPAGSAMSMEELSLREEITESIVGTSLEVDGVMAEIDNEVSQINEIRAVLESRRDRLANLNNITNFISGGGLAVVGSSLMFKDSTMNAGNILGIIAGGISITLSAIGLRQQRGGRSALGVAPNMLAKLFDRKSEFHSDYPDDIWGYLNSVPPLDIGKETKSGTRKEQLIKQ